MPVAVIKGADKVDKMLGSYEGRELFNRMRRAVRAGAKEFQGGVKAEATTEPTGNIPNTFRKVPAAKVSASRRRGGDIVAKVRPKSPLFNIFEPGAGPHEIGGAKLGGPAGGRWRRRSFGARGRVRHPGLKARPILPAAFKDKLGAADAAVARVMFEPSDA